MTGKEGECRQQDFACVQAVQIHFSSKEKVGIRPVVVSISHVHDSLRPCDVDVGNVRCHRAAASPLIATFLRDVVRTMKDVRYHVKIYIKKVRSSFVCKAVCHASALRDRFEIRLLP